MKKTKILVVDDYEQNNQALAELIQADDVEIFSATHADQALELLMDHEFGLALLDVQMPDVSGFELAKLIRGVKQYHHLPIIFVTAHQEYREELFKGYSTGGVDILFKPLVPFVVRAKVRVFVELFQQKTKLIEHMRELEQLRIKSEAANIAKSRFLANMSHEIRTPLAAVLGFSELLIQGNLAGEEKKNGITSIRKNGNLLLRLIDDILDLSKAEANSLDFEKTEFDLFEVIRDVQSTLVFKAKSKSVQLAFKLPEDPGIYHLGDVSRIKQVFLNIVGNAVKFTSHGSVNVIIHLIPGVSTDVLTVTVRDQGIGIQPDQMNRLFQPFGQADASTRRMFGGSGLGLVISKHIANAYGGDLKLLSSEPGRGSAFEFNLRLDRSENRKTSEVSMEKIDQLLEEKFEMPHPVDFSGKRILAVDDSPENLILLELFLRPTHAELFLADSGQKALEIMHHEKLDMVLMDIQMPEMDGHETTKHFRSQGFDKPIIALTAHALHDERDKCLESGCNDVMVKPINQMNLARGMMRYF